MQADCLDRLESEWLTDSEEDLVRWALNAKWSKPLRTQKKRLPLLVYKRASALEVLVRSERVELDSSCPLRAILRLCMHQEFGEGTCVTIMANLFNGHRALYIRRSTDMICTKDETVTKLVSMQVGDLHLSNPSRLNGMMEYLGYGKPDISCLGTLSEDELHGRGWQSAS